MALEEAGEGAVNGGDKGRGGAGLAEEEVEEVVVGFDGAFGGVQEGGGWCGLGGVVVVGGGRLCRGWVV